MVQRESPVDEAIRLAAERGEFDNLPGSGKPLPGSAGNSDGDDFLRRWAAAEEGGSSFLPMSLQLRKEAADLPVRVARERSEQKVRELVADLNLRISNEIRMPTSTPPLAMRQLDVEQLLTDWRAERQRQRDERERQSADRAAAAAATRPAGPISRWRWRRRRARRPE